LLSEAAVDDVNNAIDSEGSFCDVCRKHNFAGVWRGRDEDFGLMVRWQGGVDRQDDQLLDSCAEAFGALLEHFLRAFDLFLTCQKDEDVTLRLGYMDLEGRDYCCFDVVCFRLLRVVYIHRKTAAWDLKNGCVVEEL